MHCITAEYMTEATWYSIIFDFNATALLLVTTVHDTHTHATGKRLTDRQCMKSTGNQGIKVRKMPSPSSTISHLQQQLHKTSPNKILLGDRNTPLFDEDAMLPLTAISFKRSHFKHPIFLSYLCHMYMHIFVTLDTEVLDHMNNRKRWEASCLEENPKSISLHSGFVRFNGHKENEQFSVFRYFQVRKFSAMVLS